MATRRRLASRRWPPLSRLCRPARASRAALACIRLAASPWLPSPASPIPSSSSSTLRCCCSWRLASSCCKPSISHSRLLMLGRRPLLAPRAWLTPQPSSRPTVSASSQGRGSAPLGGLSCSTIRAGRAMASSGCSCPCSSSCNQSRTWLASSSFWVWCIGALLMAAAG